ncbi:putative baseplate assembly protein [Streptomyces sp. NPDC096198]|uniref:putative baseplate assembly protein n=1 Tax=Streptomyces sp. NPDC096198 TaxID=3366080 RepID=UPI0037F9DA11
MRAGGPATSRATPRAASTGPARSYCTCPTGTWPLSSDGAGRAGCAAGSLRRRRDNPPTPPLRRSPRWRRTPRAGPRTRSRARRSRTTNSASPTAHRDSPSRCTARPVVAGSLLEVAVDTKAGRQMWKVVTSFADSSPTDRHVTVDEAGGDVRFGPAVRQPDGEIRQYGAVPEIGARITAGPYRCGGGRGGNVAAATLTVLRTPISLISRVENHKPATGGVDAESVDSVRQRAGHWLRTQARAVTASDYESIVRAACRDAGRIECVDERADSERDGWVRVLIVPQVGDVRDENSWRDLVPSEEMLSAAARAVEEARPLGVTVSVSGPAYQGVTVVAEIEAVRGADRAEVKERVLRALYECLSPLPSDSGTGSRSGWPLGRALRLSDLYAVAARCEDVESVSRLEMYSADLGTGERQAAADRIDVGPATLFLSFRHQVAVKNAR